MLTKNKFGCFLLLLFLSVTLNAQNLVATDLKISVENSFKIAEESHYFDGDTVALKKQLQELYPNPKYKFVSDAFLANGYSVLHNQLNPKSESLFLRSIANAKQSNQIPYVIWTKLNYISYLYKYRDYKTMTPILLEVINDIKKVPAKEIISAANSYKKIGWILQTIGDYNEAHNYLMLAKENSTKDPQNYAAILDAIGVNYLLKQDYKKAMTYFNQTAAVAKKNNDEVRYGKALGNLGVTYQKLGKPEQGIALLKEDLKISERNKSDQNTMFAAIRLAEIYLSQKNIPLAETALNRASEIATSRVYFKKSELEIVKLKLKLIACGKVYDTTTELSLRQRMAFLEDYLQNKEDAITLNKANWNIEKNNFLQNIKTVQDDFKRESFVKNIYALLTVLVLLLALFIYLNFKKQLKNRRLLYMQKTTLLELEKLRTEQKLSETHETLSTQIEYLKDKNIQIRKLKSQIALIKDSVPMTSETDKGQLNNLLASHLMTENNWVSFKTQFKKENPEFYRFLYEEYPELTNSNRRILLLQKLKFSNTEIAELLGISADAVKKSKQRLKKKLGTKFDALSDYVI